MHYVYILRSTSHPDKTYKGSTSDLKKRLTRHNAGADTATKNFMPWKIVFYWAFPEKEKADAFERYLKSGSGRSFTIRHLL